MYKKLTAALLTLVTTAAFAVVDINKATEADLDGIKGIGPATSKQILSERKKSDFKDWDDLMRRVKGIGEARAAKLSSEGLTVAGKTFTGDKPAAAVKPAAIPKNIAHRAASKESAKP